jgi:glutaminyl-tRNA synthetase
MLDASYYPYDVLKTGSRKIRSRELYVERDDFMEDPPKKFFRLGPGREVRLRYGYFVTCTDVIKDASGNVVELRCTYDPATKGGDAPDGRKVQGTIHWVSAPQALTCELRLYDKLFTVPDPDDVEEFMDVVNRESLVVVRDAKIEPSVGRDEAGSRYQFERTWMLCDGLDGLVANSLVFNRTVTLRDSWAKIKAK